MERCSKFSFQNRYHPQLYTNEQSQFGPWPLPLPHLVFKTGHVTALFLVTRKKGLRKATAKKARTRSFHPRHPLSFRRHKVCENVEICEDCPNFMCDIRICQTSSGFQFRPKYYFLVVSKLQGIQVLKLRPQNFEPSYVSHNEAVMNRSTINSSEQQGKVQICCKD